MTMAERLYADEIAESGDLVCTVCGYGIATPVPPEHCPMCQESDAWTQSHRRPFGGPPAAM